MKKREKKKEGGVFLDTNTNLPLPFYNFSIKENLSFFSGLPPGGGVGGGVVIWDFERLKERLNIKCSVVAMIGSSTPNALPVVPGLLAHLTLAFHIAGDMEILLRPWLCNKLPLSPPIEKRST